MCIYINICCVLIMEIAKTKLIYSITVSIKRLHSAFYGCFVVVVCSYAGENVMFTL